MYDNFEISLSKNIQKLASNPLTQIMSLVSSLFHIKIFAVVIVVLYFTEYIKSSQVVVVFYSQFIIGIIKHIFKRDRPYVESSLIKLFEPMSFDEYSFPSGHVFNSYILSHILNKNTKYDFSIVPYIVGLSRMYLGVHFLTDVIGGLILGRLVLNFYNCKI